MNVRALLICAAALWPDSVRAEPVALRFQPPDTPRQTLCVAPRDLAEISADWAGEAWPEHLSFATIRRDMATLRRADAVAHLPKLERMIAGLAARDPRFAGPRALLAEIEALDAAGRADLIKERGLIARLADQYDGTSGQVLRALARYFALGIGVAPNQALSDQYLVAAARLTHPDALLTLAQRSIQARAPEAWDMPAKQAITQAFHALSSPINAGICGRSTRIARAYLAGDVVKRDPDLAQIWFRFAADLGDAQAAWTVYEMQNLAEEVAPDTNIRLSYLKQAAEAGLPFAQVALGRHFERGALVPQDLSAALRHYRRAAAQGSRAGLIRLASFLKEHGDGFPSHKSEEIAALHALIQLPDPPAWAFTRLANHRDFARHGDLSARALYRKAADLGDREAQVRLAAILMADRSNSAHFDMAVDLLTEAVSRHGSTGAAKAVSDAFMCRSPHSPMHIEAQFWRAQYLAADGLSSQGSGTLTPQDARIAALQAQALYRRPSALPPWFDYLSKAPNSVAMLGFWDGYTEGAAQVAEAIEQLTQAGWGQDAISVVRQVYARQGHLAATDLARSLLGQDSGLAKALTAEVLLGSGAALRVLAKARHMPLAALVARRKETFLRVGDFDALMMVVPLADDPRPVLDRAIAKMSCDFKSAMAVARLAGRIGDPDRASQFLRIAEHLHGEKPWAMAHLGEAILKWHGSQEAARATDLLKRAYDAGDLGAGKRMLDVLSSPDTPLFDPKAADLLRRDLAEKTGAL